MLTGSKRIFEGVSAVIGPQGSRIPALRWSPSPKSQYSRGRKGLVGFQRGRGESTNLSVGGGGRGVMCSKNVAKFKQINLKSRFRPPVIPSSGQMITCP